MLALLTLKRKGYMIKQERSQEICNHLVAVVEASVIASLNKKLILMKYLECSLVEVYSNSQEDEDKHNDMQHIKTQVEHREIITTMMIL